MTVIYIIEDEYSEQIQCVFLSKAKAELAHNEMCKSGKYMLYEYSTSDDDWDITKVK